VAELGDSNSERDVGEDVDAAPESACPCDGVHDCVGDGGVTRCGERSRRARERAEAT
jgi:hypothetical protein